MAEYIIDKFIVERGSVMDNKDGTFTVYYRVYYSDDVEKTTVLFKGHAIYDGDQQKLTDRVLMLLNKLDNTALDNAIDEIDQVLSNLSGT